MLCPCTYGALICLRSALIRKYGGFMDYLDREGAMKVSIAGLCTLTLMPGLSHFNPHITRALEEPW